jgi:hypothetical protein
MRTPRLLVGDPRSELGDTAYQGSDTNSGAFCLNSGSFTTGGNNWSFCLGQTQNGTNTVALFTQAGGLLTITAGTFIGIGNGRGVSHPARGVHRLG